MTFPLINFTHPIPLPPHPGAFGVRRKFDIHTGIDLYCEYGEKVLAIEEGVVKKTIEFTGLFADSPWWNSTQAVIIKGKTGYILYGEIKTSLQEGEFVKEGQVIGTVLTVLKKDKWLPMNMLHLEIYDKKIDDALIWNLTENKPECLFDPTQFLVNLLGEKK